MLAIVVAHPAFVTASAAAADAIATAQALVQFWRVRVHAFLLAELQQCDSVRSAIPTGSYPDLSLLFEST